MICMPKRLVWALIVALPRPPRCPSSLHPSQPLHFFRLCFFFFFCPAFFFREGKNVVQNALLCFMVVFQHIPQMSPIAFRGRLSYKKNTTNTARTLMHSGFLLYAECNSSVEKELKVLLVCRRRFVKKKKNMNKTFVLI